jgi:hypothetical protein
MSAPVPPSYFVACTPEWRKKLPFLFLSSLLDPYCALLCCVSEGMWRREVAVLLALKAENGHSPISPLTSFKCGAVYVARSVDKSLTGTTGCAFLLRPPRAGGMPTPRPLGSLRRGSGSARGGRPEACVLISARVQGGAEGFMAEDAIDGFGTTVMSVSGGEVVGSGPQGERVALHASPFAWDRRQRFYVFDEGLSYVVPRKWLRTRMDLIDPPVDEKAPDQYYKLYCEGFPKWLLGKVGGGFSIWVRGKPDHPDDFDGESGGGAADPRPTGADPMWEQISFTVRATPEETFKEIEDEARRHDKEVAFLRFRQNGDATRGLEFTLANFKTKYTQYFGPLQVKAIQTLPLTHPLLRTMVRGVHNARLPLPPNANAKPPPRAKDNTESLCSLMRAPRPSYSARATAHHAAAVERLVGKPATGALERHSDVGSHPTEKVSHSDAAGRSLEAGGTASHEGQGGRASVSVTTTRGRTSDSTASERGAYPPANFERSSWGAAVASYPHHGPRASAGGA